MSDELSIEEARELLRSRESSIENRIKTIEERGVQAYTTSCGWLNYTNEEVVEKIQVSLE